MGEGSVVLILEELEHALARGAKIYAEVAGGGMSADAYHLTATHPEGLGAILSMQNALEDAGMKPEDIDYINVHGTSTPVGDISEIKAIVEVFGDAAHKLNISSTKSMTGHLLGATGALEAMFCTMALVDDIVPHHQPRGGRRGRGNRLYPQLHLQQSRETPRACRSEQLLRLRRPQRHRDSQEVRKIIKPAWLFGGFPPARSDRNDNK